MSITEHPLNDAYFESRRRQPRLWPAFRAIWTGLGAGWRAAADYRQLSEMSDRQLRQRGLSRSDIPKALHERHFGSLGGWLDTID